MKIAFLTLGCKVNQYETAALEAAALAAGHTVVPFGGPADAYVVNSCTVTATGDKKSRAAVRQARRRSPGAVVAVCGCWAQVAPESAAALGADLVAGTAERGAFLARLERAAAERTAAIWVDDPLARRGFERLPAGRVEGRTRSMLKIEDGCVNFCTYCIIPYARGPVRSLPVDEAVRQAVGLAGEGYRELVLTGIEISSYGADFGDGTGLIDLLESLAAAVPSLRLRLGSLEPRTVTEDFCRRAAALPTLCPQLHLSLQSGCDATLRRMGRKYDTARFAESVALLRRWFDDPGVTTDLIVGFPGEDEAEFGETLSFLRTCAFSGVHIFPYSRRPGTPAAALPGQVPAAERQGRARRAAAVAAEGRSAFLARQVGRTLPVLFETREGGLWRGFAPNYVEVRAPHGGDLGNQMRAVAVTAAEQDYVTGEILLD